MCTWWCHPCDRICRRWYNDQQLCRTYGCCYYASSTRCSHVVYVMSDCEKSIAQTKFMYADNYSSLTRRMKLCAIHLSKRRTSYPMSALWWHRWTWKCVYAYVARFCRTVYLGFLQRTKIRALFSSIASVFPLYFFSLLHPCCFDCIAICYSSKFSFFIG